MGNYLPCFLDGYLHKTHPSVAWRTGELNAAALIVGGTTADGLLAKPYFTEWKQHYSSKEIDEGLVMIWERHVSAVKHQYFPSAGRFERSDAAFIVAYRDAVILCPSVLMAK